MENLDALLEGGEPAKIQKQDGRFGLNELHISKYAYEKAFRYAKLALQIRKSTVEVGGFLTLPKDSADRVARDAFLARDQHVSSVSYRVEAADVLRAAKEISQQGQKIVGWWHSHGSMRTFHSDVDDRNQQVLLNQISPSNYVSVPHKKLYAGLKSRVEGDKLVFWDPKNVGTMFRLRLAGVDPRLVAEDLQVEEEKRVGFAYSFVVNWSRWLPQRVPYCEIATRDLCTACTGANDLSSQTGYSVFDYSERIPEDEQLVEELKDRVILFADRQNKRSYFLPEKFLEQRAAGTLTRPAIVAPTSGGLYMGKPLSWEKPIVPGAFNKHEDLLGGGKNGV